MRMPFFFRSARFILSAAGFIATSAYRVARGVHVGRSKGDLESADPGERPRGRADLGGKVREGRQVVAIESHGVGELAPSDLHAVAGVAAEANDRAINHLALAFADLRDGWFCDCRHNLLGPPIIPEKCELVPGRQDPLPP